ncbi:MAG: hypothetical protein P8010_25775, partial [Desulfosarcinaceae bacterium]
FRLTAWCTQPELVPSKTNLLIAGPPMVEWLLMKRQEYGRCGMTSPLTERRGAWQQPPFKPKAGSVTGG